MYGIFTYMCLIFILNVGKSTSPMGLIGTWNMRFPFFSVLWKVLPSSWIALASADQPSGVFLEDHGLEMVASNESMQHIFCRILSPESLTTFRTRWTKRISVKWNPPPKKNNTSEFLVILKIFWCKLSILGNIQKKSSAFSAAGLATFTPRGCWDQRWFKGCQATACCHRVTGRSVKPRGGGAQHALKDGKPMCALEKSLKWVLLKFQQSQLLSQSKNHDVIV